MGGRVRTSPERTGTQVDWPGLMEALLTVEGSLSDTYKRMTNYSMGNCALFLYQGISPQPVSTWKGWQAVDRHVVKGAKAKWVLRPITVKSKDQLDDNGQPKQFLRFKLVRAVFALEDTAGEPLPKTELPEWSQTRADEALGVRQIPFDSFDSNVQGFSIGNSYAINPVAKWPEKTHKHELMHIIRGHTALNAAGIDPPHRGIKEFEAESGAHLLMNELGLVDRFDPSESRAYLQGWLRGETPPDESIRGVFSAVDKILKSGRPEAAEEPDTQVA